MNHQDESPNKSRGTNTKDLDGNQVIRLGTRLQDAQETGDLTEDYIRRSAPLRDGQDDHNEGES